MLHIALAVLHNLYNKLRWPGKWLLCEPM